MVILILQERNAAGFKKYSSFILIKPLSLSDASRIVKLKF